MRLTAICQNSKFTPQKMIENTNPLTTFTTTVRRLAHFENLSTHRGHISLQSQFLQYGLGIVTTDKLFDCIDNCTFCRLFVEAATTCKQTNKHKTKLHFSFTKRECESEKCSGEMKIRFCDGKVAFLTSFLYLLTRQRKWWTRVFIFNALSIEEQWDVYKR